MKNILLSLIIIALVSTVSVLVTKAYFTDKKVSAGNTFAVGTLNLEVGDFNGASLEPFIISDIGSGVNSGEKTWKTKNTGSLPGQLIVTIENIQNNENGCNEPEEMVDSTCGTPGVGEGELGNFIKVIFSQNGNKIVERYLSNIANKNQIEIIDSSNLIVLEPNTELELKMEWSADEDYGNEIQSDSLSFDMGFSLRQLTNN